MNGLGLDVVKIGHGTLLRKQGRGSGLECDDKAGDEYTVDYSSQLRDPYLVKNNKFVKGFGENVRQRRDSLGISQEDLAFKAKLHRTAITHIECGNRASTLVTVEKLAKALKVQPAELMQKIRI